MQPSDSKSGFAKKLGPKGHDAVLKALQDNKRNTTIINLNGDKFAGTICGRDKYTITLLREMAGGVMRRQVFYKHSVESFYGDEPTPRVTQ